MVFKLLCLPRVGKLADGALVNLVREGLGRVPRPLCRCCCLVEKAWAAASSVSMSDSSCCADGWVRSIGSESLESWSGGRIEIRV